MKAGVFLDRDGTLIEDAHYPKDPAQVRWIPGAADALREIRRKGYLLFVVSNQSGVGRGLISEEQFLAVHERFCELLREAGVEVAEFGYCLHHPDDPCRCRKPETGLVPKTHGGEPIDFSRSWVVGDRPSDMELGARLGARTVLVRTGKGSETEADWPAALTRPDHVLDSLSQLVSIAPSLDNDA